MDVMAQTMGVSMGEDMGIDSLKVFFKILNVAKKRSDYTEVDKDIASVSYFVTIIFISLH